MLTGLRTEVYHRNINNSNVGPRQPSGPVQTLVLQSYSPLHVMSRKNWVSRETIEKLHQARQDTTCQVCQVLAWASKIKMTNLLQQPYIIVVVVVLWYVVL